MARNYPDTHTDFGIGVIIERNSGYYWKFKDAGREHGPFGALIDAISDMEADDLPGFDADDADEAEFGVGAAAWTDPDSGLLPEASILHLEEYN